MQLCGAVLTVLDGLITVSTGSVGHGHPELQFALDQKPAIGHFLEALVDWISLAKDMLGCPRAGKLKDGWSTPGILVPCQDDQR